MTFLAASDVDDLGVVAEPIAPQDGDALTRPKVSEAQVAKDASQRSVRPDLEQRLEIGLRPHPTITFSQERERERKNWGEVFDSPRDEMELKLFLRGRLQVKFFSPSHHREISPLRFVSRMKKVKHKRAR